VVRKGLLGDIQWTPTGLVAPSRLSSQFETTSRVYLSPMIRKENKRCQGAEVRFSQ
jgi:hypothetical protein